MLKHFQQTLEPTIKKSKYNAIDDSLKQFFNETYSKNFDCSFCPENCSPEIFSTDGGLFIHCDNDTLESPYEIDKAEAVRFKFDIEKFCKIVAQANNINFLFNKKANETFYFGGKNIDGIEYQFYYMLDLARKNQLTDIALQKIKSLKQENSRLIILTPDNLIQDNKTETLLKGNFCSVVRLGNCIKNDLIINIEDLQKYDLIVNADTFVIKIYGVEYSLASSLETFTYIYNLAQHPKEIISIKQARGVPDTYQTIDKTLYDATRKINDRFILKLKNEFIKQNKPSKHLEYLIKIISQTQSFYLNLDKEKIKFVGCLPA